jgi:hypothetical protein
MFDTYADELLRDGLYRLWIMVVNGEVRARRYSPEEREPSPEISVHQHPDGSFCQLLCKCPEMILSGLASRMPICQPVRFSGRNVGLPRRL